MATLEIRSFNLTVSTKEPISDESVAAIAKWIRKSAAYFYIVCENDTGKRHLHATIVFEKARDKKKIQSNIWGRMVKPHHPTSIGKYAVHIQACPGLLWLTEYLKKDQGVEIIDEYLPETLDMLEGYFPTEEEQVQLMACTEDKVSDPFLAMHEVVYKQWLTENTWVSSSETAHQYFKLRMYVRKDLRAVMDPRRVHQMACALHAYSVESYALTAQELNQHVKEHMSYDFAR